MKKVKLITACNGEPKSLEEEINKWLVENSNSIKIIDIKPFGSTVADNHIEGLIERDFYALIIYDNLV